MGQISRLTITDTLSYEGQGLFLIAYLVASKLDSGRFPKPYDHATLCGHIGPEYHGNTFSRPIRLMGRAHHLQFDNLRNFERLILPRITGGDVIFPVSSPFMDALGVIFELLELENVIAEKSPVLVELLQKRGWYQQRL